MSPSHSAPPAQPPEPKPSPRPHTGASTLGEPPHAVGTAEQPIGRSEERVRPGWLGRRSGASARVERDGDHPFGWIIAALALALFAAIAAYKCHFSGDWETFHWILVAAAVILALLGTFLVAYSYGTRRWMLAASCLVSAMALLLSVLACNWADWTRAAGTAPAASSEGHTGQAPPPAPAPVEPELQVVTVPAPDPNFPDFDEIPGPGEGGAPGTQELLERRYAAARTGLPEGHEYDFYPPYSKEALSILSEWELQWYRDNATKPGVRTLAYQLALGPKADGTEPDGESVADFLQQNADLVPVGAGGVDVYNWHYMDHGVEMTGLTRFQEGELVWVLKDGTPVIQFRCGHFVEPIRK